jgi:hypothetical protein
LIQSGWIAASKHPQGVIASLIASSAAGEAMTKGSRT